MMVYVSIISGRHVLTDERLSLIQSRTKCRRIFLFLEYPRNKMLLRSKSDVEIVDREKCLHAGNILQKKCRNTTESESLRFFTQPKENCFGFSKKRNLSELYLISKLQKNSKNTKIVFLDDDVLPPTDFSSVVRKYETKSIIYGGYYGQPPFRMYWNDDLNLRKHNHIRLNVAVNFSSNLNRSRFRRVLQKTLRDREFRHNLWYSGEAIERKYFLGGSNIRNLEIVGKAPCLPYDYRGYDDVFRGSLLYSIGHSMIFLPGFKFDHQKRNDRFCYKHLGESFFTNDMSRIIDKIFYQSNNNGTVIDDALSQSEKVRRNNYNKQKNLFFSLFGNSIKKYIPQFTNVLKFNNKIVREYFYHLYGWYLLIEEYHAARLLKKCHSTR